MEPVAKSAGRVQAPTCACHNPFSTGFVCPTKRTRSFAAKLTPSIVCNPVKATFEVLTTTAGVFATKPVVTVLSTYAFVATSVGLVTVPLIVIMLVAKFPNTSRTTIAPPVLILLMVANFALEIVAFAISALTICDVDNVPFTSVCTTPTAFKPSIVTLPDPSIFIRSTPLVSKDKTFGVAAENPVLVLPVN